MVGTDTAYLFLLLQIKGIDLFQLSFLAIVRKTIEVNCTYQMKEEGGFVRLQCSLLLGAKSHWSDALLVIWYSWLTVIVGAR